MVQLLAFDTSTDAMSVAVSRPVDGRPQVWEQVSAGGASASARLIPVILDLLAQAGMALADLDAIVFGRGPGAFTGLRTACSVAQGLALGARSGPGADVLPLLPVDSLLAVAEQARHEFAPDATDWPVLAMLDARMDQVYAGAYRWHGGTWGELHGPVLAAPQELQIAPAWALAGNVFASYGERLRADAGQPRLPALPAAAALLRLAPGLLAAGKAVDPAAALPLYVRDKVASTSAERAQARSLLAQERS